MPPGQGGAVHYGGSHHGISLPNQTIYVNNLNDKLSKDILRRELYVLFSQFGSILDIVAMKTPKMRGQAFIVFQDIRAASIALSKLQDFEFYGKRLRIAYGRSKSDAVAKEEGTFVPRHKRKAGEGNAASARPKKVVSVAGAPAPVAAKGSSTAASSAPAAAAAPPPPAEPEVEDQPPNKLLFLSNLPVEITEIMLQTLFKQFPGLDEVRMVPGKPGIAFVEFGNETQSAQAKDTLQGFKLTPTNAMRITFAKQS
mmetsp:Transcript_57364/g.151059  ORF Transcript_57364/g.151059 Transcript_57364/m.151059 type:complete len:255 (+) Transcript_57364:103-867(+)|eukprot:CAMPEP_0113663076 /NCGR_PEP_ID=MMETSP0038_2-20120614/935_1 /TAXON_ID=2898 /ORGANISM="Cryptomonas paramecium" /LENGTH=254 /DNA_ID=CAMNT_0000578051 /DNA_START=103 /DNA_END=867 /DNA_ORIENTATION=- /assembly_acc=CAM_ASM_000170